MTTINASDHIAQIVTSHPACAALFTEHKIDFCCHGEVALEEVCKTRGLDVQDFLSRLRAAACAVAQDGAQDMSGASTAELIAHIVSRHHTYLRRSLPALEPLVAKVARVHGEHNPKLRGLVDAGVAELRLDHASGSAVNNGNLLGLTSSYTTSDGATRDMADVWFTRQPAAPAPELGELLADAPAELLPGGGGGGGSAAAAGGTAVASAGTATIAPVRHGADEDWRNNTPLI